MDAIARQVCANAGGDTFLRGEDAETVLRTVRNYVQPATLGRVYQQESKLSQFRRTDQTMERYPLEFGVSSWEADAGATMGGTFADGDVPILCLQNAAGCRAEKSLSPADVRGPCNFLAVAKQMRR